MFESDAVVKCIFCIFKTKVIEQFKKQEGRADIHIKVEQPSFFFFTSLTSK